MSGDLAKIDRRMRDIATEMDRLQKEADELAIAKRVLERLQQQPSIAAPVDKDEPEGRPRPKGTPTNFEMVELVLADAERTGKDGLTAGELVDAIAARYWPGLAGAQILPSIYKFAKDSRLRKTAGGKFKRVKKAEPSPTDDQSGWGTSFPTS